MGGVVSAGVDNDELVDKLKEADYIRSSGVEKVLRLVDRGYYITKDKQNVAYRDSAWKSGNLHLSAPCIYAQVMEGLQLSEGLSFLNIGSGTGYLSTLAGLLIGPRGVNHGIELHGDLVEYAQERLNWLIGNTGVVDVSFLCEPQFSQGNALCLGEDVQLYDRVYCGASCPPSHEDYLKNLIKENGILVMPRNDKLLRIKRISSAVWSTESLLPVSFSPLVLPDQTFQQETVELPAVQVISLQELARDVIRSIFRSHISNENEGLKHAFVCPVSSPRPMDSAFRNFSSHSFSDSEYDSDGPDVPPHERDLHFSPHLVESGPLSVFFELAQSLANRNFGERERIETRSGEIEEGENSGQSDAEGMLLEEDSFEVADGIVRVRRPLRFDNLFENIDRTAQMHNESQESNVCNQNPKDDENTNISKNNNKAPFATCNSMNMNDFGERDDNTGVIGGNQSSQSALEESVVEHESTFQGSVSPEYRETRFNFDNNQAHERTKRQKPHKKTIEISAPMNESEETCKPYSTSIVVANEGEIDDQVCVSASSSNHGLEMEPNTKNSDVGNCSAKTSFNPQTQGKEIEIEDSSPLKFSNRKSVAKREMKRREKIDSGIVEDLDPMVSMDDSSSCSFHSRSYSSHSSEEKEEGEECGDSKTLNGNSSYCFIGKNRSRRLLWRKREATRRKRKCTAHGKEAKESRIDSNASIDKYSKLMKEKINELPLPFALKVYVNYNRPL